MKAIVSRLMRLIVLISVALTDLGVAVDAANSEALNTAKIEELTGLKGKLDEKEGVFKVSYPRDDLNATVAGVKVTPPMGVTCWVAFTQVGDHTMIMGD